ncbi:MAG: division/cell wall cluster transcriptional repressor MraZ [Oscillospiraceae bacterium]|nr:division/cell wall cluster transcriptional repressor MraZ [Oscillospiraceae bacterium]
MTGEYSYTLDAKGRVAVPARLRGELGNLVYLCRGIDHTLFLYPLKVWEEMSERLSAKSLREGRHLQRSIFSTAERFDLDAQGRILIPQKLRDYADLQKNVVIVGAGSRAEIWSEQAWRDYEQNELTEEHLLEAMDELGF